LTSLLGLLYLAGMPSTTPVGFYPYSSSSIASATQMMQPIINAFAAPIEQLLWSFVSPLIPTVVIGIVLAIVSIIFTAMTFGRIRRSNGLHPSINRFIGSVSYFIVHSTVIIACFEIWGLDMLDKSIFYMLHLIAFMLVRIILLATEVWVY